MPFIASRISRRHGGLLGILGLAFVLRVIPLWSCLPYLSYTDEGHVLHPVMTILKTESWDPGWYRYPSLPIYAVAAAATAARPPYHLVHGRSLLDAIPDEAFKPKEDRTYDLIAPSELILAGRVLTLLFSLGIVAATCVLGVRAGGPAAGLWGALLAAVAPSLVIRSAIVLVDPFSACLTTIALVFADRLRTEAERPTRLALLAGAVSGLAFTAKYTAAAVALAVAAAIAIRESSARERLRLLALSGAGFVGAALAAMPALALRTRSVLWALRSEKSSYWQAETPEGYVRTGLRFFELGIPFVLVAIAGLVLLAARKESRRATIPWLAFAGPLLALLLIPRFQPFRNVLPLVPLLCVGAGASIAAVIAAIRDRWPIAKAAVWTSAVALVVSLGAESLSLQKESAGRVDARVRAVDWLARETRRGERVLLVGELTILPSEIHRIPATVEVQPWSDASTVLESKVWNWIVTTELSLKGSEEPQLNRALERWRSWRSGKSPAAEFGGDAIPRFPSFWRGNYAHVLIYRTEGSRPPARVAGGL